MPGVRVKEHEAPEIALRRFKRICEKAGVLSELRRREFYEKPTWERKRKRAAARKRLLKKLAKEMLPGGRGKVKRRVRKSIGGRKQPTKA